jgi:hypothetical protein
MREARKFEINLSLKGESMRTFLSVLIIAITLAACGPNLREKFDESLNQYSALVRWNDLDAAGMFAADSRREDFIARTRAAKNVKVMDYRIVRTRYDEKKHRASVDVEIEYYLLSSARLKTLRCTEEWAYGEEKKPNGWRLMSLFPEFR